MLGDNEQDRYGEGALNQPSNRAVSRANSDRYPTTYPNYQWYEDAAQEPSGIDIQKYLRVIRRHWLMILASLIVCLAGGLAKVLLTTPIYTTSATLQIDRESARVANIQNFEAREATTGDEFFQTQYGLLKSRSLAEATAKDPRVDLARDTELLRAIGIISGRKDQKQPTTAEIQAALTNFIQENLAVAPVLRSRLVQISIGTPSPRASAVIANAVADNYIDATLNRRLDSTSYARNLLQEQLAAEKAKLENSERQLAEYARSEQIINLSSGGNSDEAESKGSAGANQSLAATNLTAMNNALSLARGERIRAEQRWRNGQSNGTSEVLGSPIIQQLKQNRMKLDSEYQEALGTYSPSYEGMQQMRARLAELDKQIQNETSNIQSSLENQYKVALAQERQLEGQVRNLTTSVLDLRSRSIKYDILQREIDTSRQLYDGLLQSYKEIGVANNMGSSNIFIIDRAQVPTFPSKPQPASIMMTAAVLGILLGVCLAFLLETLDESIRSPEDVENKLGIPLLGTIPKLEKGTTPIVALADVRSNFSEAYYSVRTALQFSTNEGVPSSLIVTSARPSEGKSTSSTAIAQHFARLGSRVLLIDSDLRNPSLHKVLNAENQYGFSNYLTGGMTLAQLAQDTSIPGLSFIPCGPMPPNPAELLGSAKLEALLREARETYDLVLIDAPPVMGLADAPLLASAVAGTVLVVESGGTGRRLAKAAVRRLAVGNAHIIGIVLTKFDARKSSYGYGYGYGYAYDYQYGNRPAIKA